MLAKVCILFISMNLMDSFFKMDPTRPQGRSLSLLRCDLKMVNGKARGRAIKPALCYPSREPDIPG